jgi:hypothetical protein
LLQGSQSLKAGGGKKKNSGADPVADFLCPAFITRGPGQDHHFPLLPNEAMRQFSKFIRAPPISRNPTAQVKANERSVIDPVFS